MKLLFKQRIFSWFDSYDIYNEHGDVEYIVKGELSWGHLLRIYDSSHREVGVIKQKVLTFLPCFEIYANNTFLGCIKRELTFFKSRYKFDFNGWNVDGDWLGFDYKIIDSSNNIVATISKELWKLSDTYVIDIHNSHDALCVLMSVLAIDIDKCSQDQ